MKVFAVVAITAVVLAVAMGQQRPVNPLAASILNQGAAQDLPLPDGLNPNGNNIIQFVRSILRNHVTQLSQICATVNPSSPTSNDCHCSRGTEETVRPNDLGLPALTADAALVLWDCQPDYCNCVTTIGGLTRVDVPPPAVQANELPRSIIANIIRTAFAK